MNSVLAVLLVAQTSATSAFDASIAAHKRLKDFTARVEMSGTVKGQSQRITLDLTALGNTILLRQQESPKPGFDRVDRTYLLRADSLVAYDAVAHERLQRRIESTGPRLNRLMATLGGVEEPVALLLEPDRLSTLFLGFKQMKNWQTSTVNGGTRLARRGGNEPTITVQLQKDRLLRELTMTQGKDQLQWRITYSPLKPATYTPPANARLVASFLTAEAPPKYASKAGEQLAIASQRAMGALLSGLVIVDHDEGQTRVVFDQRRLREGQPNVIWMYDGTTLAIHNRKANRFYRGPARRGDVLDIVTAVGGRVDPFTRSILLRRVPFKEALSGGMTVAIAGEMKLNGVEGTILRGIGDRRRVSMLVRKDNRLVQSITTDLMSAQGQVMSTSNRTIQYLRINATQPQEEFAVTPPRGVTVQPLPQVNPFGG
jgi:hypothetical protein